MRNGDKNSKFFHVITLVRRRYNRINALKTNSEWITDEKTIVEAFISNLRISMN